MIYNKRFHEIIPDSAMAFVSGYPAGSEKIKCIHKGK